MQTLLKLERWVDAIEFCDRALQVDSSCVKAMSRRASAFVELAGKLPPFREESYSDTGSSSVSSHQSRSNGKISQVSNQTGDNDPRENHDGCDEGEIGNSKDERRDHVSVEYEFHDLRGGRAGLLALALEDLDKAVEVDRGVSEDLQQQRDDLRKQIEEETVSFSRVVWNSRILVIKCRLSLGGSCSLIFKTDEPIGVSKYVRSGYRRIQYMPLFSLLSRSLL